MRSRRVAYSGKGSGVKRRIRVVLLTVMIIAGSVGVAPAGAATVRFSNRPVAGWRAVGVGQAVLVVGDTVYVGGDFSTIRNNSGSATVSRANLAAFDVATGVLRTSFRADTNGTVRALATDGSRLFVGGSFSRVNGTARSRLAAVDLDSGAVQSFTADANSNVYALAVGGGRLYVGGSFSSLQGRSRSRLASVQLSDGSVTSFSPSANNSVRALAVAGDGGAVYAAGDFTSVGGSSRRYLARLNPGGQVVSPSFSGADAPVFAVSLRADGSRLAVAYAGFSNQGAYYNTSNGARLWSNRCDGDAQAISVIEDSVFVGFHEGCNGDTSVRVMSYNATNGSRDSNFRPTFDKFYGAWAAHGNSSVLAIAGDFTRISGVAAQGFAIFPRG